MATPRTTQTDTGGRISRADAAERMYGTGSKQHRRALAAEGRSINDANNAARAAAGVARATRSAASASAGSTGSS